MPFVYLLNRGDVNYVGTTNTGLPGIKAAIKSFGAIVRKWETKNCPEAEKKIWYDLFKGGLKPEYKILSTCETSDLIHEKQKWEAVYYKKEAPTDVNKQSVMLIDTAVEPLEPSDPSVPLEPSVEVEPLVEGPNLDNGSDINNRNVNLKGAVSLLRKYYSKKYSEGSEATDEKPPSTKLLRHSRHSKKKNNVIETDTEGILRKKDFISPHIISDREMSEISEIREENSELFNENLELQKEVEELKTQINGLLLRLYRANLLSLDI